MSRCDIKKWPLADLNNDTFLQLSEYYAFNFPWLHDFMHELQVDCMLKEWDKDEDGLIDVEEFAWIMLGHTQGSTNGILMVHDMHGGEFGLQTSWATRT